MAFSGHSTICSIFLLYPPHNAFLSKYHYISLCLLYTFCIFLTKIHSLLIRVSSVQVGLGQPTSGRVFTLPLFLFLYRNLLAEWMVSRKVTGQKPLAPSVLILYKRERQKIVIRNLYFPLRRPPQTGKVKNPQDRFPRFRLGSHHLFCVSAGSAFLPCPIYRKRAERVGGSFRPSLFYIKPCGIGMGASQLSFIPSFSAVSSARICAGLPCHPAAKTGIPADPL